MAARRSMWTCRSWLSVPTENQSRCRTSLSIRSGERVRFLPDSSGVIYMVGQGPSQDFWLLDLATMVSRQLTQLDPVGTMRTFDITPDGQRIVFDRESLDSDIVLIERPLPEDSSR